MELVGWRYGAYIHMIIALLYINVYCSHQPQSTYNRRRSLDSYHRKTIIPNTHPSQLRAQPALDLPSLDPLVFLRIPELQIHDRLIVVLAGRDEELDSRGPEG